MDCFALKGTFIDTPTPDALRVREGYLLFTNKAAQRVRVPVDFGQRP